MTVAITDPAVRNGVDSLVDRLRANRLPPPAERRSIRRRAGASLEQVAAAIGVQKMTVSRWERGTREPWPRHLAAYICLLEALAAVADEVDKTQK
uniref:helix-turn-helix domain-containing protein n=1 Tax=Paractinoplanes polyasparticus TaxID=2856853 RepID=UPI001C85D823|nr:helix-turn-helix transcriptional regulator [Actinoplanes polyasparticus]